MTRPELRSHTDGFPYSPNFRGKTPTTPVIEVFVTEKRNNCVWPGLGFEPRVTKSAAAR